jgi:hypothetical protein
MFFNSSTINLLCDKTTKRKPIDCKNFLKNNYYSQLKLPILEAAFSERFEFSFCEVREDDMRVLFEIFNSIFGEFDIFGIEFDTDKITIKFPGDYCSRAASNKGVKHNAVFRSTS